MPRLFETEADLSEYLFRIVDNGGATADRYTVIFSDGDYLAMSGYPTHPQGISLWGGSIAVDGVAERVEAGEEIDLTWNALPETIRSHVLFRASEGWRDFVALIEARDPSAVAPSRMAVTEINEGLHDCGGKGLYVGADGALWVRTDNMWPEDDRGPYTDAYEAMRATLPDQYGLGGDEYHSTLRLFGSPEDDAEALAAVEALEARRDNDRNGDEPLPQYEGETYPVANGETRRFGEWYNFGSNVSYMKRGEDSFRMRLDTTGEIIKPAGSAGDDAIDGALYRGEDAEVFARFNFGEDFKPKA